jgi:uncharacterized Tic20 family protein
MNEETPPAPPESSLPSQPDPLADAREVVERETAAAPALPAQSGAGTAQAVEALPAAAVAPPPGVAGPMPAQDERIVAALSHLMVFFSFAWIPVAIIIAVFLVWRDRSPYVRFQSAQALGLSLVLASLSWLTFTVLASSVVLWCLMVPAAAVIVLAHLYSLWGAAAALQGSNFVYLGVGPVVAGLLDKPSS